MLTRHTKKKLDSALRTVASIKELDFPYQDSLDALDIIEGILTKLHSDISTLTATSNVNAVKTLCQRSLETIQNYLPILGFIVRSTDLDGPVELQGPLLRLTHDAVGKGAKLIISSEWDFSPFTILFPELSKRNFVLVGMPCSEANNALIAPLAGHELGHNIWNKFRFEQVFENKVREAVVEEIRGDSQKWHMIIGFDDPDKLTDLIGEQILYLPWSWAMSQCEEMFCDYIGLIIFRESYLHAFVYLLAPGLNGERNYRYPRLKARVEMLILAANKLRIAIPDGYLESFDDCERTPESGQEEFGKLSDSVCGKLKDAVFYQAQSFAENKKLCRYSHDEVERIYNTLMRAVPATASKCISDIVSAGWRIALENRNFLKSEYPSIDESRQDIILNELILKSFEVFEIEQRQIDV